MTASTHRHCIFATFAIVLGLVSAPVVAGGPVYEINWDTIDGGGGDSVGGSFELSGTIGQHDAGSTMAGGSFQLVGGFRAGAGEAAACPADLDGSGDVGFSDLLAVLSAWGSCVRCPEDLDGSGDVGFSDLLTILSAWGPC